MRPSHTAVVTLAAVASACSPFSAEPIGTSDASVDAAGQLDATAPDAAAPDAAAPDASPRGCTPPACLFLDDFEGRQDVKGPWDLAIGAPVLVTSGGGNYLRVDGAAGATPPPAYLSKTLSSLVGVEVELGLGTEILSGTFGTGVSDVCELVAIELGGITLAMLYADRSGIRGWVWANAARNDGASGNVTASSLPGPPFLRAGLTLRWTGNSVTMTGRLGGVLIPPATVAFEPSRAASPVAIRVGLVCTGTVAGMRLGIDDVSVRAL